MKKLLISILFVLVGLFAVDRAGGFAMQWVYDNTDNYIAEKIRYLADEADEDVILLGTSRCNFHYVSPILGDSLGMTVYNGGVDGSESIFSHYISLSLLLEHHTPKIVCLELMGNDFAKYENPFEAISVFAPYVGRSAESDSIFYKAGSLWKYEISHLYRYNSLAVNNIGGMFFDSQEDDVCGYIPNPKPAFHPDKPFTIDLDIEVDQLKMHYLQKFIDVCRERDIKVVFAISPMFCIARKSLYAPIDSLAKKNGIPFLDYHTSGLFLDHPEFYRDGGHLWDKGARLFTSIFAHDLKQLL